MRDLNRITAFLTLTLILGLPSAWAQTDGRCIIMVDRFEDQIELPQFVPVLDQVVTVDHLLAVDIDASTPVSQEGLTFQLIDGPPGMTIDPATGVATWVPDEFQLGIRSVTVAVTDSEGRRNRHIFCLSVIEPNIVQLSDPGNFTVVAGETLMVQLQAASGDSSAELTFSKQDGPADLTVDERSGQVIWPTVEQDLGSHDVLARVADQNNVFDEQMFRVEVTEPIDDGQLDNRAPTMEPIDDQSVAVGQALSIQTAATDPDGDKLTYELLAAPIGMTINNDGLIELTPPADQSGPYSVNVRVSDPLGLSDTVQFVVMVIGINNAPVALDDDYELLRGDVLTVSAPGVLTNDNDPDGDALSVSLVSDASFGTLSLANDGSFDYTPDNPPGTLTVQQKLVFESSGTPIQQPLVMDMDGNGVPDIIFHTFSVLGAVQGDTGDPVFEVGIGRATRGDKAIADIDLDGRMEIVLIGADDGRSSTQRGKKLIALEHDGQLKWISEAVPEVYYRDGSRHFEGDFLDAKLSIADLDQDGTPEIVVGWGRGGNHEGVGYSVFDNSGMLLDTVQAEGIKSTGNRASVEIVDLDLDGDPEIITGSAAFSHEGELLWSRNDIRSNSLRYHGPIAVNLDDDPYPELVRRTETGFGSRANTILAWNHDGTDLWQADVAYVVGSGGPPLVITDVNSDGQADILSVSSAAASERSVTALNGSDGATLWRYDISEQNFSSAATVLDLDRDGFNEVVYPYGTSPTKLLILDGRDGTLKLEQEVYNGSFIASMPIFADVDADGASELVLVGHQTPGVSSPAFYVYESVEDDWPPMRGVWNQWNYHVTNILADGTVPQFEQPHWLLPGLNQNRANERLPQERSENFDQFTYTASDGTLTDQATVFLRVLANSNPPQILSQPDTTATVGFPYRYAPIVTDPDPGETFTFELTSAPVGMTINSVTGLLSWAPNATGANGVGIVVTDTGGLSAVQSWTLLVGEPVEVPDVIGLSESAATTALTDADLGVGSLREAFSPDVPAGQVANQAPSAGTVAEFGAAVDLDISVGLAPEDIDNDADGFTENQGDCNDEDNTIFPGAPDPEGDGIDQNCDGVDGELALESIELSPAESLVLSNRIIDYQAIGLRADGTAVNLNGLGVFASSDTDVAQLLGGRRVRSAVPGTATISLSHQGVTGEATISVVAGASLDNEPPVAEISSPLSAQKVTRPIEIIGTADDANLLRWELLTRAGDDGEATLLNSSSAAVTDGVLGELDPTLLLNGVQTLILRVYDRGENISEARVNVTVEEDYKVGNFTLTFEDLDIALASLPITVNRTYDSREKRRGDFGIGWDLGLRTVEVRTNRVLGTGWEVLGGGFGFQLNPTDDHLVTVTLPGGEVETFQLEITPNSSFLVPFSFATASLEPIGNTLGELTLLDNPFLAIVDGQPGPVQLLDDASFGVFNPQRFRYVARNGLEFVVSRKDGLESFSDTNGNTLTFSDEAITHSNGTAVQFQRDGLGRITRLTDPSGNEQVYGYDSNGDLATHTDAEGHLTRFRYDARHNLLEVIDPRGNRAVRNEYDDDGRLTAIIDAEGHRIEFTHDIAGREQLIEDANGNIQRLLLDDNGNVLVRERTVTVDGVPSVAVEQYEYDERGNRLVQVNPDGIRSEMSWDEDDNLIQTVVDPGGLSITTSSTYDARNNRLTETDALGRVTTYTYDEDDNVVTISDPLGGITRFSYTGDGKLATLTDPVGTVTSYFYDAGGQLVQEDVNQSNGSLLNRKTYTFDASARRLSQSIHRMINGVLTPLTTQYEYDNNGRQVGMTDPLGNLTQTEYDAAGNVAAQIDALGRRTEHSYNSRGQRVQTTHPDGTTTAMAYDPDGNVISRTDELGRVTTYEFDELNRQIAVVHPDGERVEEVLSEGGQTIATIDANGHRSDFTYDAAGRQISALSPQVIDARNGSPVRPTVTQSYDATGRVIATTDANGHQTGFTYDALGRLTRTDPPDGTFTTQGFDAAGRVTSTTDALGRTTDYGYDGLGRLLSVTEPAPATGQPRPVTTYTWDLTGKRLTQTDALGRTTRMQYDALGRQIRRTLPGGQFATAAYDAVGNVIVQTDFNGQSVAFAYDARNRLVERILPDGEVHGFTYSPTGARLTSSASDDDSGDDSGGTQTFTRDLRDRLVSLTQADGTTLSYQFDPAGNLVQTATATQTTDYSYDAINRLSSSVTDGAETSYGYDPNGNLVRRTRPNLSVTENTFDSRNRVLSIEHQDATATVIESFVHTYRDNGQRETVTELDGSVETYSYDGLDRLVSETRTGTTPRTIDYQYDLVGNRTEINQDGLIRTATYDPNDRLLSEGTKVFTYDANGNRTSASDAGSVRLLDWNGLNWLTSVEQESGVTTFTYNADGERIGIERDSGSVERYLIDPQNTTGFSQVTETRNAQGEVIERFRYGSDLISRVDAVEGQRYFHTDALGSTRLLTDATTQATDRYSYTGYGVLANASGSSDNAYLYAGERRDEDTDDYYLRARYYDPAGGRFISRDPFKGIVSTPMTMHPYLYASSDPINNIDPLGLFTIAEVQISSLIQFAGRAGTAIQYCTALKRAQVVADVVGFLAQLTTLGVTQGLGSKAGSVRYNREVDLPETVFGDDAKLVFSYLQTSLRPFEAGGEASITTGGTFGISAGATFQYQDSRWKVIPSLEPFADLPIARVSACGIDLVEVGMLYRPLTLQAGSTGGPGPLGATAAGNVEMTFKLFNTESRVSFMDWNTGALNIFGYPVN